MTGVQTCALPICQVMYALRDDIELSQVYYSTVYLVEEFYTLIATEMRSVKRDISYWEVLAESSHWEIYLTQLHNKIYRRLFARGKGSLLTRISRSFTLSMNGLKRIIGPPTLQVCIATDCLCSSKTNITSGP